MKIRCVYFVAFLRQSLLMATPSLNHKYIRMHTGIHAFFFINQPVVVMDEQEESHVLK